MMQGDAMAEVRSSPIPSVEILAKMVFDLTLLVGKQSMQIDDLNAAVAKLETDVEALLASTPVSTGDTDLAPVIAAVQAIDAQVVAATPAPGGTVTPPPVTAPAVNPTFASARRS